MRRNINTLLDLFLLDTARQNAWLKDKNIAVYVRKSRRVIEGMPVETLEIGSVSTKKPGRGFFKYFILHLESKGQVVFVENVFNLGLLAMLVKANYTITPTEPPCAYRRPK